MKADSIYKLLVYLSLLFYAFIYTDTRLIPVSWQNEKLEYSTIEKVHYRYSSGLSHIIKTERDKIIISEPVFLIFADYDSLDIGRSSLTGIPQTIGRDIKGEYYRSSINFMNDDVGKFIVPFFLSLTVIFWLFYSRIKKVYLRERFSIISVIISIGLVLKYLL